jgi:hypothetical protein
MQQVYYWFNRTTIITHFGRIPHPPGKDAPKIKEYFIDPAGTVPGICQHQVNE